MSRSLLNSTTRMGDVNPVAGAIASADGYMDTTSLQVGGAGAQVDSIAIASASDGDTITVNIGEDSGSLTSCVTTLDAATGASNITAAAAVADTINATIGISNLVFAANNGTDDITITGKQKGAFATFTTTASSVGASATVTSPTSPTDATALQFGLMCEQSTGSRAQGTANIGSAVGTGTYTAQIAITPALTSLVSLAAGDVLSFTVNGDFDGLGALDYTVTVPYSSSVATTIDQAIVGLNLALPANSVVVTEHATNALTFTAEVAGLGFTVSGFGTSSGVPAMITFAEAGTTANAIPDGGGVVLKSHSIEQDANGVAQYTSGQTFSALTEGKVIARLDAGITVAVGDACFVRIGTASTTTGVKGAFSNVSDSGDNVPVSAFGFKGTWLGASVTDMDGNNTAALHLQRA